MIDWFHWDGWPSPAEWQAFAAVATALIALTAAIIAVRQYRISVRNQIEQARPFITVDFEFLGTIAVCVSVENTGRTAAYDVTFKWDKLPVAVNEISQRAINRGMVDGGIPFLAPGRKIRFLLNEYDDDDRTHVPRRYEIEAFYRGPERTDWTSQSTLDIDQWAQAIVDRDPYQSVADELKKLAQAAAHQKHADEVLIRAADSVNVFLEASPRVKAIRKARKDLLSQRRESLRKFEAQRRAKASSPPEETNGESSAS